MKSAKLVKVKLHVSIYPIATALLTGHVADFYKTVRGVEWRVEVYDRQPLKYFKGESPVSWDKCPMTIKHYCQSALEWLNSARTPYL